MLIFVKGRSQRVYSFKFDIYVNIYERLHMKKLFCCFYVLLFLGSIGFCQTLVQPQRIVQVGAGEYLTTYRTEEGKLFVTAYTGNRYQPVKYNITAVKAVDGAQYTNIVLDSTGNVFIVGIYQNGVPYAKQVKKDAYGNDFTGNTKVYGWYQTYLSIKKDSLFIWGEDLLWMNNGVGIEVPVLLPQPIGKQIKKIVTLTMGEPSFLALATDGSVWIYKKKAIQPVRVKLNAAARDIAGIGAACYVVETANDLLAWGYLGSYLGTTDLGTQPVSIKKWWTAAGCTFPSKELVGNYNTLHIIDANDHLFGAGENVQGEIGNGIEHPNWKGNTPMPYAWTWKHNEMISKPVQIHGKFKNLNTSNTITFYFYVQDMGDQWYSWGRNKARSLGNGVSLSVLDEAKYPNALDVPAPKKVSPLSVKWKIHERITDKYQPLPIAHSGIDQYIKEPFTTLSGKFSSAQGSRITTYKWEKISGDGSLIAPDQMITKVTGLSKGEHFFKLTVTDEKGAIAFDDVKVVVH